MHIDGIFDLRGSDAMARDVHDVIDPTGNSVISVLIPHTSVAREIETWVGGEIGCLATLVISVSCSDDGWPGIFDA